MPRKFSAFSFLEAIIVLAIIGILLMATIPLFSDAISSNGARTHTEQIFTALQLTRMEALKRRENVRFCKSVDHKTCGGSWHDGQIIISKSNVVLRVFSTLPASDKLTWQSSFGKNDYLEFLPSGNTNAQQGSFYYCPKNPSKALAIIIKQTGHMRVANKTAKGGAIPCDF